MYLIWILLNSFWVSCAILGCLSILLNITTWLVLWGKKNINARDYNWGAWDAWLNAPHLLFCWPMSPSITGLPYNHTHTHPVVGNVHNIKTLVARQWPKKHFVHQCMCIHHCKNHCQQCYIQVYCNLHTLIKLTRWCLGGGRPTYAGSIERSILCQAILKARELTSYQLVKRKGGEVQHQTSQELEQKMTKPYKEDVSKNIELLYISTNLIPQGGF